MPLRLLMTLYSSPTRLLKLTAVGLLIMYKL